jgi:hypothetical protein
MSETMIMRINCWFCSLKEAKQSKSVRDIICEQGDPTEIVKKRKESKQDISSHKCYLSSITTASANSNRGIFGEKRGRLTIKQHKRIVGGYREGIMFPFK